ncbi:MAG: hypothetical protein NVS1B6_00140 [Steroidobacteraceae bacterium]
MRYLCTIQSNDDPIIQYEVSAPSVQAAREAVELARGEETFFESIEEVG